MFYYVQYQGEEVVAWIQSNVPKNRPGFIQVTPEEFLELGGHGLETPRESGSVPSQVYSEMAQAIKEGVNEV